MTNDIAQPDTDQDPHHPRLRPAVSPPPPRQGGPGEPALDIYTYLQIDIYITSHHLQIDIDKYLSMYCCRLTRCCSRPSTATLCPPSSTSTRGRLRTSWRRSTDTSRRQPAPSSWCSAGGGTRTWWTSQYRVHLNRVKRQRKIINDGQAALRIYAMR